MLWPGCCSSLEEEDGVGGWVGACTDSRQAAGGTGGFTVGLEVTDGSDPQTFSLRDQGVAGRTVVPASLSLEPVNTFCDKEELGLPVC